MRLLDLVSLVLLTCSVYKVHGIWKHEHSIRIKLGIKLGTLMSDLPLTIRTKWGKDSF
jgi:hypothetical protein